jgi:Kef-type K+ transport system membrane component KefB
VAAAAVVTVLMFLLVAIARGVAQDASPGGLALRIGLALLYVAVMIMVVRPALAGMGRKIEAAGALTPGTFAAAVLVLFGSAFVAHVLGINVIVGGFLAGVVLPARAITFPALRERLFDLTAIVLLPIFLAFSGLNTDFTQLSAAALPGIALFLIAGVVGKWLGGALAARLGGLTWAEGNVLGILMNCRGLLILVAALVAVNAGVITPVMQVGTVLMALITTIMTGPLFDRFAPSATKHQSVATTPPSQPAAPTAV